MISNRIKSITPSATIAFDSKAKKLEKEGKDIVILAAGEPDFETPENVKKAAIKAINNNFTNYTAAGGINELKEAVSQKFKNVNNIDYDTSQVTVNCGGKHSLFNVIMSTINKGDEVIIPKPYWVSYIDIVKIAEGIPVICETDEKFKLNADKIMDKISNKTKLLIINSPNNPSGSIIEKDELKKIAKLAIENKIFVISDEVYEHFIYGNKKHTSIGSLSDEMKNLTITVNSVSKTYSMTGWRIGFCGANNNIIKAMEKLQSHSTSNPTSIAQMAALEALTGQQESIKKMKEAFDIRRKFIFKRLNEIDGLSCIEPEGAFYAFPNISETNINSMEFSSKLLEEALVATVPGIAFGSDKHVRLSYAASMQELEKGLDRIEFWLKKNSH